MQATTERPRRFRTGFRAVTLLVTFTFGCATVRVPASAISPTIPVHEGAAEPQVELWLESGKDVTPAEAAQATAQARAALEQALGTRRVAEGEQLLVVRAQGVSRTASRRADQSAAVAGIVVGAVVIVAAVVVAVVAGKGGGGGKGGGKIGGGGKGGGAASLARARPAPVPVAVAPRPPGIRPVAVPRPAPVPVPGPATRPAPVAASRSHRHGSVSVGVHADVQVPYPVPDESPAGFQVLGPVAEPGGASPARPFPPEAATSEVALPPPEPLDVARRGFFAKDLLRLELTLVDRQTGTPLWVKTVEGELDPRDAAAVQALLDGALDDPAGWTPAAAPRA